MPSEIGIYGAIKLFGVGIGFTCEREETWRVVKSAFADWPESDETPSIYVVLEQAELHRLPAEERREARSFFYRRVNIDAEANGETRRALCRHGHDALVDGSLKEAVCALVLFLVCQTRCVPFHASAILVGDITLLFAGASGSGKSTLALAGHRAGYPVLSDDTIFVQTRPFRIWFLCSALHVYPRDAPAEQGGMRLRGGRWKKSLALPPAPHCIDRAQLYLLARGDKVGIAAVNPAAAAAALTHQPEPGYEFYGLRAREAAEALTAAGAWQLTLSHDPAEAIAFLTGAMAAP